jgi:hypothetical protein
MTSQRFGRALTVVLLGGLALSVGLESSAFAQAPAPGDLVAEVRPARERKDTKRRDSRRDTSRRKQSDSSSRGDSSSRDRSRRASEGSAAERRRRSKEVTVPVDLSVGPSFFMFGNLFTGDDVLSGPIYEDQPVHYGLRFNMAAVIDYEFVRKNPHVVPRKYRGMFKEDTVVFYKPAALSLIPRNLYLSPKRQNTSVYGATWKLLGVGLNLIQTSSARLGVGVGGLLTYAHIDSDAFASPTHFLRPGLSLDAQLAIMLSDTIGFSAGWSSNFYLPQDIGGGIMDGSGDDALWHIGESFVMLHYRFPFMTTL